ncbi:hypothetical protein [Daejeonella sp.]|uniref:hypothetical protein n=1 Tax=Daejeonella sp. TaxID=2805397 RepID=UPI003982DE8C
MGLKLMMCILILLSNLLYTASDPSITSIRLKFHNSTTSEAICKDLINQLEPYNERKNPLLFGYRAGATMLMAKHSLNPFSKLSYFKKGKNMLEKAILAENNNVELRFLRYTIQTNIPSFLGYSSQLEKDRSFLKQSVSGVKDAELKKIIVAYLKQNS